MSGYTVDEQKAATARAARRAVREGYDEALVVFLLGGIAYDHGQERVEELVNLAKLWTEKKLALVDAAREEAEA